jgi:hypothetical protein
MFEDILRKKLYQENNKATYKEEKILLVRDSFLVLKNLGGERKKKETRISKKTYMDQAVLLLLQPVKKKI